MAQGEEDNRWLYGLLGATVTAYAGVLAIASLLYVFFKPGGAGSCSLNVALITTSLLLCVAFSALSLAPLARNGSLFPSAAISLYIMYLCYSALQSEPRDYEVRRGRRGAAAVSWLAACVRFGRGGAATSCTLLPVRSDSGQACCCSCHGSAAPRPAPCSPPPPRTAQCNGLGHRLNAASGSTLVIGMLVTLLSVVYSALRAGSNTRLFMLDSESEGDAAIEQPLLDAGAIAGARRAPVFVGAGCPARALPGRPCHVAGRWAGAPRRAQ